MQVDGGEEVSVVQERASGRGSGRCRGGLARVARAFHWTMKALNFGTDGRIRRWERSGWR